MSSYPTNLAQLKKFLSVGRVLTLHMDGHKMDGVPRKIEISQSNAVKFEGGSWLYYSKAGDYSFTPEGFKVNETGWPELTYIYN